MNDLVGKSPPAGEPVAADGPIAVFESIHGVLAAERAFSAAGLACDLVPIPRGVHSDCGMALVFRATDLESARALLTGSHLCGRLRGIYVPGPAGYAPDAMTVPRKADDGPGDANDVHLRRSERQP